MSSKKTVACIPAYNEESSIAKVVMLASKFVDAVVVCDDGSSDLTGEIASRMGAIVVMHDRNLGYGAALRSLFSKAEELGADAVVTLDGDGQHLPSDISAIMTPVLSGEADLVIGSRFLGSSDAPNYRVVGVRAATALVRGATGLDVSDAQSGFRAYSQKALRSIEITDDGMGASVEILQKAVQVGLKVVEVPVNIRYDVENPSTHNPLFQFATVIASTIKHTSISHPLIFYGLPGGILILVGLVTGFVDLSAYTGRHGYVSVGYTMLTLGALTLGLVLAMTGITLFTVINVVRESRSR
ncbi:MAG TPA: glycosyltransferase family 2 protein [Nitrososphaerales archaeon]|nr:glycosyltransferase family 2 protein [Nitrososphaerales archaeon]